MKAAYLLNFTRYAEWPASAFSDPAQPVTICLYPDDPFNGALERVIAGRTSQGRPVVSRRISQTSSLATCHVLYLSQEARDPTAVLQESKRHPVLTVIDDPDLLDQGGILAFRRVGPHLRFDANQEAASRAGLRLGSALLDLAVNVRRDPSLGRGP